MPVNYRMEYALKAREAVDVLGITTVIRLLKKHIGVYSAAEMTESQLVEATLLLNSELLKAGDLATRQENWRKQLQEEAERKVWNAAIDQLKAERQRRRKEKKVSG